MGKWKLAGKQASSIQQRWAQRLGLTWSSPMSLLSRVALRSQFWPVCSYRMGSPGWPLADAHSWPGCAWGDPLLPVPRPPKPGDSPGGDPACAACSPGPPYRQKFLPGAEALGRLRALADSSAAQQCSCAAQVSPRRGLLLPAAWLPVWADRLQDGWLSPNLHGYSTLQNTCQVQNDGKRSDKICYYFAVA